MARRRRSRRGGRHGFKIPIISAAILGGQVALAAAQSGGDIKGTISGFAAMYTGYNFVNQAWEPTRLVQGYAPWLVKRFLLPIARPRLPVRGLPISLS